MNITRRLVAGCFVALLVSVAAGQLSAQAPRAGSSVVPRTAWGTPDFNGMWTNQTITGLERPPALAGKRVLTEAEAAAYAREFLESNSTDRRDGGAQADVSRAYPDYFIDRGTEVALVKGERRTSHIVDPPDGRIPPLTPAAQQRLENRRRGGGGGADAAGSYDNMEDRPLAERCLLAFGSSSGPPMLPVLYNNHYQIVQTKDYVMILVEMVHDARIIPLDGRPHLPKQVRRWMGDSVGRWEGNTLVVDTTNFNEQVSFRGSGPDLHVIERFTRTDANTILYQFTVDDPATFTRPWSGEIAMRTTDDMLYEYACHEGNHALESIMRGARFQERNKTP